MEGPPGPGAAEAGLVDQEVSMAGDATVPFTFRIDKSLKPEFEKVCSEMGLPMGTMINIFVKTVVREQRVPFRLDARPIDSRVDRSPEGIYNWAMKAGADPAETITVTREQLDFLLGGKK